MVTRADPPSNLAMAAYLITVLPVVIVYFFVQKKLIGGIASVGLKG
jgi:multiple sugar transport system permease protein